MEFLIGLGVIALLGAVIYAAHREQERWKTTLRLLAQRYGLHVNEGGMLSSPTASGTVGKHRVTVDTYTVSTGKSSQVYTRVRVQANGVGRLSLGAEGMFATLGKAFMGEDVSLGVPAVDDLLVVRAATQGDALARLGHRGRAAAVRAVNGEGARLKDGVIEWTRSGREKDLGKLQHIADTLLELATATDVIDTYGALADHVEQDPDAGFRYRCLETLAAAAPRSAAAERAARAALNDSSPHLQLAAMRFFHVGGPAEVAALVTDDAIPSDVRASAIDLLIARFSIAVDTVLPAVQQAFDRGRYEALGAAVRALAALDKVPAIAVLRRRLEHADLGTRAEMARAARRRGSDEAQPFLLELLASEEVEVVTAAAESLGQVGSIGAVEALDAAGSGFTTSRDIKSATRAAIARIQERAGGEGGGLSLSQAAGDGGELSIQTIEEGALSEVEG